MDQGSADSGDRFSLVVGGPFHGLLRRVGLTGEDQLPTPQAALAVALLAWLPPALVASVGALVDADSLGWSFLGDLTVHTRYLVAVWVMIATERYADARILMLTRQFRATGLLSEGARSDLTRLLGVADRRSSSPTAEAVILAAALVWPHFTASYTVALAGASWEGTVANGAVVLSWAGETARFVSTPLFLFLVLRWIWRFLVWSVLLLGIARLRLELTPLHPDRSAGLGFLSMYPSIFSGFVFALSCVVAAAMIKDLGLEAHTAETVWLGLAGWLGIVLVLFLGPLLVFAGPLYEARQRGLLEYGRLATQHHLTFHRKWVGGTSRGEDLLGSIDPSSTADLNASVEAVLGLRFVPVDRAALAQLLVAAGLPLLAVVLHQMPLAQLAGWIAGTIL